MNEFNPYEGPKKKKSELGSCDYKEAYLFIISYLQSNTDKMFTLKDFNFMKEFLIENCGM